MNAMPLVNQLLDHAESLRFAALPQEAVAAAITFITDSVAVGLAGSRHARLAEVQAAAAGWGQAGMPVTGPVASTGRRPPRPC